MTRGHSKLDPQLSWRRHRFVRLQCTKILRYTFWSPITVLAIAQGGGGREGRYSICCLPLSVDF